MVSSKPLHQMIGETDTDISTEDCETGVHLIHRGKTRHYETCTSSGNFLASGTLFRLITKSTGLWNPRKKHYAVLCALFVLLNVLSLVAEIVIPSVCGPFVNRCVTNHVGVTLNASRNGNQSISRRKVDEIYEVTLAFDAWNAFSDTMTYILLIYTIWRMRKDLPSFSLASAHSKLSTCEWLVINLLWIVCSLAIIIASALRISSVERNKMKFYGAFGIGVLIVYLCAFTCCCVFAVLTCALSSLVDNCLHEIHNMDRGTLNDITSAHQKLCKQLNAACELLKPWFLMHWFMFGTNCLAVFAFDSMHIALLSQEFSGAPTIFMAVAFALNFMIFLLPCVYASRVTWKCDELIYKVSNMSSEDWKERHPFRERSVVNDFIFYAERSKCGFRIGKMTFGSSATWISVVLGLLGLVARLVTYIN